MTEFGITEEDMKRIEDAIENGMSRLKSDPTPPSSSSLGGEEEILENIREMQRKGFQKVTSRGISRYMGNTVQPAYVGKIMSSLAEDGYVDRIGDESPYRWDLATLQEKHNIT